MKKVKLFPKTFLFTFCLMLIIVLVVHTLIFLLMPVFYQNHKKNLLEREAEILMQQIQELSVNEIQNSLTAFSNKMIAGVKLNYNGEFYNEQSGGEFYIESTNITFDDEGSFLSAYELIYFNGEQIDHPNNNTDFIMKTSSYIIINRVFPNQPGNYIMAFISLRSVNEATNVIITLMPITTIICVIISVVFSFIYAKTITKPIKHISFIAEQMEKLDPNTICEVRTSDEIGILAVNLNQLYRNFLTTIKNLEIEIQKVGEAEKLKTDFLRAASHELKTPVTAVNAMLENMMLGIGKYKDHDMYIPKCKEMIEQLSIMIKDMLDTSRLNLNAENEKLLETDIVEFILPLIEPYQIIAKSKGSNFNIEIKNNFNISVPQKLFGKAISNILSNAVSYTEKDRCIYVRFIENNLVIENECQPIPQDEIERLFEPFYRIDYLQDRNSGGNGLGLYIVDIILKTLQIKYEFEQMNNQQGMSLTMKF